VRPQAKPGVNFFTRVDIETNERRRRLQARTGYSAPRLVGEALQDFENNLVARLSETERRAYYDGPSGTTVAT
jgi:hypothetical protein